MDSEMGEAAFSLRIPPLKFDERIGNFYETQQF